MIAPPRAHSALATAVFATTALAGCDAEPQVDKVFLNLSFEHATPQGHPLAWYIEADAERASVSIDPERSLHESNSLRVQSRGGEPVVLYTPLLPGPTCLEHIRVQASVSTMGPEIHVSLFFLVPGEPLISSEREQEVHEEWRGIQLSLAREGGCLPPDVLLGLLVEGPGQAWVDGLQLTTNDPRYRVADIPPRAAPPGGTPAGLAELAMRVEGLDPATELHDLEPMAALFDRAHIVGLGENSHGARALFRLKHRMARLLVEEMGFTVFALEMPAEQAMIVNDYVLGRSDDERATLLALTYPSWQSEEMWAVIEWLRSHNRGASTPVTFHGLDTPRDDRSDDQRMAAEAERLLDDGPEGRRMVIWADNSHVTKAGRAMGAQLVERYGRSYVAVGTTFNEGHYMAYGREQRYAAHAGYPGTHEHLLAQVGMDAFLLDLAAVPPGHVLREPRGFRYIGSMPQTFHQFYPHRLHEHFDVLGFVRRTESTRLLLEHEF